MKSKPRFRDGKQSGHFGGSSTSGSARFVTAFSHKFVEAKHNDYFDARRDYDVLMKSGSGLFLWKMT